MARYKQVIAVRNDLKMGKGKLAVQVAHAAVTSAEKARLSHREWFKEWWDESQAKICVKVKDEAELRELKKRIEEEGLTQLEPGTTTCLGIGPLPAELADRFTGHLKLL